MRFSPHIAINVNDLDKAQTFYKNVMGFEFIKRQEAGESSENGIHMKSGNVNFWIDKGEKEATFLEFACEDVSAKLKELIEAGCVVTQKHSDTSMMMRDPYGMRFHLFQESKSQMPEYTDTMIAAKNYKGLIEFYKSWGSFIAVEEAENFTSLKNPFTNQTLCLTSGGPSKTTAPGFATKDLAGSLKSLESLGGKVLKTWEYGPVKGANCADPEGNEIILWQGSHA